MKRAVYFRENILNFLENVMEILERQIIKKRRNENPLNVDYFKATYYYSFLLLPRSGRTA
jgi:hypothetical protein